MDFSNIFSGGAGNLAGGGGKNPLQTILDMIGSKGGQTITNAVGAGMSAYGQGKQAEADRAQTAGQFNANLGQRQLEGDRAHQLDSAVSAANASPLGEAQLFAQRNAIAQAILGGARNFSATPGDASVAAAMGSQTGGLKLPGGGLDPAMLEQLFGGEATSASIANRQKMVGQINPRSPVLDIGTFMGRPADGSENPFTTDVRTQNQQELTRQMDESAKQRAIIQAAIDEDVNQKKQKRSTGSRLGGAAAGALSGASMGSFAGPIGAGIGGIIGGLKGLF
jgi:hypothetical protein